MISLIWSANASTEEEKKHMCRPNTFRVNLNWSVGYSMFLLLLLWPVLVFFLPMFNCHACLCFHSFANSKMAINQFPIWPKFKFLHTLLFHLLHGIFLGLCYVYQCQAFAKRASFAVWVLLVKSIFSTAFFRFESIRIYI